MAVTVRAQRIARVPVLRVREGVCLSVCDDPRDDLRRRLPGTRAVRDAKGHRARGDRTRETGPAADAICAPREKRRHAHTGCGYDVVTVGDLGREVRPVRGSVVVLLGVAREDTAKAAWSRV